MSLSKSEPERLEAQANHHLFIDPLLHPHHFVFPHTSSSFQPITSVPHILQITGSRYFGVDHEHVEEIVDERKCRDLPLGQNAFDAARTVKVFHSSRESHEVPEQVQHKGQNAYDAAQEHEHLCGDGGSCRHGGTSGSDGIFGKGNVSLP